MDTLRLDNSDINEPAPGVDSRTQKLEKLKAYSKAFYATEYGKQTKRRYLKTEKGRQVHRESVARYRASKPEAITRYETSEARKEYKRQWAKEYRARKKAERLAAESQHQPQDIRPPIPGPA